MILPAPGYCSEGPRVLLLARGFRAFTGRGGVLSCGHISISPARKPRGHLVRGSGLAQGIPGCHHGWWSTRGHREIQPGASHSPPLTTSPSQAEGFLYSVVIVHFSLFSCGRSDSRSRYSLLNGARLRYLRT